VWEHEVFEGADEVVRLVQRAISSPVWLPSISWRVTKVVEIDPELDREQRCLQDLRNPLRTKITTQRRSTKKWKRTVP
jgi:hypothetical protein